MQHFSSINVATLTLWDSTFGKMSYHNWQLQNHILQINSYRIYIAIQQKSTQFSQWGMLRYQHNELVEERTYKRRILLDNVNGLTLDMEQPT